MTRKKKIALTTIASVLIIAFGAGVSLYIRYKSDCVAHEGDIYVPTGATFAILADSLGSNGKYIKDVGRFNRAARATGLDKNVRPGRYKIKKGMSYIAVAKMFQRGLQTPVKLTFNNIRTLEQLAGRVSRQIEPDSLSLIQTMLSDTMALHYGFSKPCFMAMFIPETYEVYWNISTNGFLDRMKKEYDKFWTTEREEKLAAIPLTRTEAVTLASIVYEETKMSDEMPAVAGVYINRLRLGMPLQADPTVKFAVGDFTLKRILHRHLEVDSPYNTYKNTGLPPGPICMPSVKAIDAVLNYQHHKYLYFCAKPDFSGYHNFAVTLAEHNRNAQAWANALNRAGIR